VKTTTTAAEMLRLFHSKDLLASHMGPGNNAGGCIISNARHSRNNFSIPIYFPRNRIEAMLMAVLMR
jgi:hypothetical protein